MGTNSPDPFEGEKIRPWERSWFSLKQLWVVLALTRSNDFQGRQKSLQERTRTCRAQAWCMHSSGNKGPEARGHLVRLQGMCLPWTRDPKMPRNSSRPFSSQSHVGNNVSVSETEGHFPDQSLLVSLGHFRSYAAQEQHPPTSLPSQPSHG